MIEEFAEHDLGFIGAAFSTVQLAVELKGDSWFSLDELNTQLKDLSDLFDKSRAQIESEDNKDKSACDALLK